jgi:hypothetical protein
MRNPRITVFHFSSELKVPSWVKPRCLAAKQKGSIHINLNADPDGYQILSRIQDFDDQKNFKITTLKVLSSAGFRIRIDLMRIRIRIRIQYFF